MVMVQFVTLVAFVKAFDADDTNLLQTQRAVKQSQRSAVLKAEELPTCQSQVRLSGNSCPVAGALCEKVKADVASCWSEWEGEPGCSSSICHAEIDANGEFQSPNLVAMCQAYVRVAVGCDFESGDEEEAITNMKHGKLVIHDFCYSLDELCNVWSIKFIEAEQPPKCDFDCDMFEDLNYYIFKWAPKKSDDALDGCQLDGIVGEQSAEADSTIEQVAYEIVSEEANAGDVSEPLEDPLADLWVTLSSTLGCDGGNVKKMAKFGQVPDVWTCKEICELHSWCSAVDYTQGQECKLFPQPCDSPLQIGASSYHLQRTPPSGTCADGYELAPGLGEIWDCNFSADPNSGVCIVPRRYAKEICDAYPQCSGISEPMHAEWTLMYPGKVQLTRGSNCYEPNVQALAQGAAHETAQSVDPDESVPASPWHVECLGDDACKDKTLTFAGYGDRLTCHGKAACKQTRVDSHGASDILCSGDDACQDSEVNCLGEGCRMQCTGKASCKQSHFVCAEGKTCYFKVSGVESGIDSVWTGTWVDGEPSNWVKKGWTQLGGASRYFASAFPQNFAASATHSWDYDGEAWRFLPGSLASLGCQARNWHRRNEDWTTCFKENLDQTGLLQSEVPPSASGLEARAAAQHDESALLDTAVSRKGCVESCTER